MITLKQLSKLEPTSVIYRLNKHGSVSSDACGSSFTDYSVTRLLVITAGINGAVIAQWPDGSGKDGYAILPKLCEQLKVNMVIQLDELYMTADEANAAGREWKFEQDAEQTKLEQQRLEASIEADKNAMLALVKPLARCIFKVCSTPPWRDWQQVRAALVNDLKQARKFFLFMTEKYPQELEEHLVTFDELFKYHRKKKEVSNDVCGTSREAAKG